MRDLLTRADTIVSDAFALGYMSEQSIKKYGLFDLAVRPNFVPSEITSLPKFMLIHAIAILSLTTPSAHTNIVSGA